MGLAVTFVSGVRRSGKSALIRTMIDRLWKTKPHYIRLFEAASACVGARSDPAPTDVGEVASTRHLVYDAEHIFEILPESLTEIHHQDRFGCVVIEADADAALRHAYPYDHRVFVMPAPYCLKQIFRDPARAAVELQRVLDDTAAFASEIFGLFDGAVSQDCQPSEARPELEMDSP